MLLGYNIFKGNNASDSRDRIMTLPLPDFRQLNPKVDARLNEMLHRLLARELDKRYASADELLYDLEYYIYHKGYGPTNETLGKFMRELFGQGITTGPSGDMGKTVLMEKPAAPVSPEQAGATATVEI